MKTDPNLVSSASSVLQKQLLAIRNSKTQAIPIGKFFPCYDRLLSDPELRFEKEWNWVKTFVAERNHRAEPTSESIITRSDLKLAATACEGNWVRLYLIVMLWGYGGAKNRALKDGPTKTYVSLRTANARATIDSTAAYVARGEIGTGYDRFCRGSDKLNEIGPAFGTKFLYAVGLGVEKGIIKPLVYDNRIQNSLDALLEITGKPGLLKHSDYLTYCEFMRQCATAIDCNVYDLEQRLFELGGGTPAKALERFKE